MPIIVDEWCLFYVVEDDLKRDVISHVFIPFCLSLDLPIKSAFHSSHFFYAIHNNHDHDMITNMKACPWTWTYCTLFHTSRFKQFLKLEYMLKIIWSKSKFQNLNTQAHFHLSKSNTFGFPHITLQCDDFYLIFNLKLLIAIAITSRCFKTFVEWHTLKNIKWYNWFSSNCCVLKIWKPRACSLTIHSLGKTTRATRWLGWIDALHIQILNTLITQNKQIRCLVQFEHKLTLGVIVNSHAFHHDLNQFI